MESPSHLPDSKWNTSLSDQNDFSREAEHSPTTCVPGQEKENDTKLARYVGRTWSNENVKEGEDHLSSLTPRTPLRRSESEGIRKVDAAISEDLLDLGVPLAQSVEVQDVFDQSGFASECPAIDAYPLSLCTDSSSSELPVDCSERQPGELKSVNGKGSIDEDDILAFSLDSPAQFPGLVPELLDDNIVDVFQSQFYGCTPSPGEERLDDELLLNPADLGTQLAPEASESTSAVDARKVAPSKSCSNESSSPGDSTFTGTQGQEKRADDTVSSEIKNLGAKEQKKKKSKTRRKKVLTAKDPKVKDKERASRPTGLPKTEYLTEIPPKKPQKRKQAKFLKPIPSRYCHVCARTPKTVRNVVCAKMKTGYCRKVVCERCFSDYGWDWRAANEKDSNWICPHCMGNCPKRAQCHTYSKTNDRLRVKRIIEKRATTKNSKRRLQPSTPSLILPATAKNSSVTAGPWIMRNVPSIIITAPDAQLPCNVAQGTSVSPKALLMQGMKLPPSTDGTQEHLGLGAFEIDPLMGTFLSPFDGLAPTDFMWDPSCLSTVIENQPEGS